MVIDSEEEDDNEDTAGGDDVAVGDDDEDKDGEGGTPSEKKEVYTHMIIKHMDKYQYIHYGYAHVSILYVNGIFI